jgi:16S rRNA (cytidine1402-2'-O)-methyltransferase
VKLLEEIIEYGYEARRICIARELTKMYEEFLRGTVQQCLQRLAARPQQKGEFVIVLEGAMTEVQDNNEECEHRKGAS